MARVDNPRDVEITDVQTTIVEGNFRWTLVRIYTDAGVTGTGECVIGPKAEEYIDFAKHVIIGENPIDIDARVTELFDRLIHVGSMGGIGVTAISGIDIALHDLAGKLLDVPAHTLLGGSHRDEVRVYCDSHAGAHLREAEKQEDFDPYAPEAYADAAEDVVNAGFDALKFDLDASDRYLDDPRNKHVPPRAIDYCVDLVEAVTDRVSDRADVAFDCHWSWSGDSVRRLATSIEEYPVLWLEDTVPPENMDLQVEVTKHTDTTICAGENMYRVEGARRAIENQGVDVIHPDVPKTGGMRETKKVGDMAKAYHIPLALHNVASPVGTMATAHVAAASSNFLAMEYHAREVGWWDDLHTESDPLIQNGRIDVPDDPGLGIDLDLDVVEANLADGEELFDEA